MRTHRKMPGPASDSVDLAYVSPAVVRWALKRSRLSDEAVASRLKISVDQLQSWQQTSGHYPSFREAEALAKLLHVPFGCFFLSKAPREKLPLPDFRGFDRKYEPSIDLLDVLNDVLVKQDWYREHQKALAAPPHKFVNSFSTKSDIKDVAKDIRARLGLGKKVRESASNWSEYLSILTKRSEAAGLLVMRSGVVGNQTHRVLNVNELKGFAIADAHAPIVFVNSTDYKASQIFTLAHELSHVWIGQSAIANADELDERRLNTVEEFCNAVAAEVLVPAIEFKNEWLDSGATADVRVTRTARRFWVSTYVTLRRARELGEVSRDQYETIKERETERRKRDKSSGGDYFRNMTARMSNRLTDAVMSDVVGGKLELKEAAGLLAMKVPTLLKFAEKWK